MTGARRGTRIDTSAAGRARPVSRRTFLLGLTSLAVLPLAGSGLPAGAFVPFKPFTFAFITNSYLTNSVPDSFKLTQESQLFLQEVVKLLNRVPNLDFVMFGGDQVEGIGNDQCNWQLFLDVVHGLNAPWSFVLGEADVSGRPPPDKMRTFGPDWKAQGIDTDTPFWSLNPVSDVHIVGLDTSLPNRSAGEVSEEQLTWLRKDLAANKKYLTIVFSHHPLLPPPPYDGGPPWDHYVIPDGAGVREVLGEFPQVRLVVSGHLNMSRVQQEKGVWHVSSPSLVVYPCSYRLFRVTPEAVTMETYQLPFPALVKKARKELDDSNLAFRFNNARPQLFAQLAEGRREDRDCLMPLAAGKTLQALKEQTLAGEEEKGGFFKKKKKEEKKPEPGRQAENTSTGAGGKAKKGSDKSKKARPQAPKEDNGVREQQE